MPLYENNSAGIVTELIARSNPTLPERLDPGSMLITGVTTLPSPDHNTQATLRPTPGSNTIYVNQVKVRYDRIHMPNLFKGMVLEVAKYSAKNLPAGESPLNWSDLLPAFNAQFGVTLELKDFTGDAAFPAANKTTYPNRWSSDLVVNIAANCPAFTGPLTVRWLQADPDISNVIAAQSFDRTFTNGALVSNKPGVSILDLWTYPLDFSAYSALIQNGSFSGAVRLNRGTATQIADHQALVTAINSFLPTPNQFSLTDPVAQTKSLNGFVPRIYSAANAADVEAKPEIDFKNFEFCLCLDPTTSGAEANTWAAGSLFLHFNS